PLRRSPSPVPPFGLAPCLTGPPRVSACQSAVRSPPRLRAAVGRMATAPLMLFVAQTPTGPFCFQARLSRASADLCAVSGRKPTIEGRAGESSELRALRPQADYVLTGSAAMIRGRLPDPRTAAPGLPTPWAIVLQPCATQRISSRGGFRPLS